MSNDKLRDAVSEVLSIIQKFEDDAIASPIFIKTRDIKRILEKALEPEQEFWPGQAITITDTIGGKTQGIYLDEFRHGAVVYNYASMDVETYDHSYIEPDKDAPAPPGYLKIREHDGSAECPAEIFGKRVIVQRKYENGSRSVAMNIQQYASQSDWRNVTRYAIWPESEGE